MVAARTGSAAYEWASGHEQHLVLTVIAALSLRATPGNHLPAWINLAVGFWVFFSPWALQLTDEIPVVVKSAITGALIMIFALARSSAGRPASV
jgi:SPW repeat-containing protein